MSGAVRRLAAAPLLILALAASAAARDLPPATYPLRDEALILDEGTAAAVRRLCVELERDTRAELGVLIVDSTEDEQPRAFGLRVFNAWGVGKRGENNGVLLLFAMAERRIEIVVGTGYEELFTPEACSSLLQQLVVPRMRAHQPREAILAATRAIAYRVRDHEALRPVRDDLAAGRVEAVAFGGGTHAAPRPDTPPPPRPSAPLFSVNRGTRAQLGRQLVVVTAALILLAWASFVVYVLHRTFTSGELIVPRGGIYALSLLVPAGVATFLVLAARGFEGLDGVDYGVGGAGVFGGLVACAVASHICPRCNKYMETRSRTIVPATYHSSGTGERTYHCSHCGYHRVETYTIARKTRSTSRSYSSSSRSSWSSSSRSSFSGGSSSRSSFGGGSSRGGGGGASW